MQDFVGMNAHCRHPRYISERLSDLEAFRRVLSSLGKLMFA
jgi:hypothetical protein